MKHLISLSLKYVRRQRLRTFLTFTCIMLAVFLMASFGAYLGSVQQTIIRYISDESGSAEVNVSNLLKDSPKENARDILKNHAVVNNYCISGNSGIDNDGFQRDENGWFGYLTLQLDNGYTTYLNRVRQSYSSGDPYLAEGKHCEYSEELPEGSIIVPEWIHDLGYEIGDTVTFTLTAGVAQLDPESDQIQEAVRLIESMNAENEGAFCYIRDGQEYPMDPERRAFNGYTMMQMLGSFRDLDEIDMVNETVDGSVTFTATIADFQNDPVWGGMKIVNEAKHSFLFETSDSFGILLDPAAFGYGYAYEFACIEVTDNIEFETALMELLLDMGFDKTKYYDYYTEEVFNTDLLGAKLKGADAISFAFYGILILLMILLVVWLVARFIIDNAFEISVQERSSQFAVLRIMGASRNQLFGLVLTEAVFYCLTAVPLGTILAVLCCKLVMNSFAYAGLDMFIFHIHPLALFLSVVLAVAGVMISSYTSAMWAARKLSPLEALQYGKPKKKQKLFRHRKTRFAKDARRFMLRYTIKNIGRTGKRFVVSTIALTLGVMLFVFCSLLTLTVRSNMQNAEIDATLHESDYSVYAVQLNSHDIQLADSLFKDSEAIRAYDQKCVVWFLDINADTVGTLDAIVPYDNSGLGVLQVYLISEEQYAEQFEAVVGMDYAAFSKTGKAFYYASSYKDKDGNHQLDADGNAVCIRESGFHSISEFPAAQDSIVLDGTEIQLLGTVNCQERDNLYDVDCLYLPRERIAEFDGFLGIEHISIMVNGPKNREVCLELIDRFLEQAEGVYSLTDMYYAYTGCNSIVNAIFTVSMIFLLCIWLVGVLSMVNAINTSVLNRQNELVMMRAVGMTIRQLYQNVFLESCLFTVLSSTLGVILGLAAHLYVLKTLQMLKAFQPVLCILVVLLTIVLNLGISLVSAVPGLQSLGKRLK